MLKWRRQKENLSDYCSNIWNPAQILALKESLIQNRIWDHVVVVPVCAENESIDGCIAAIILAAKSQKCRPLLMLVVNHPLNAAPEVKADNSKFLARLRCDPAYKFVGQSLDLELFAGEALDLLLLDRTRRGEYLVEHKGVGSARKWGADAAALFIWQQMIRSDWIHNTDADARVDCNFFLPCKQGQGVELNEFEHVTADDCESAWAHAVWSYDAYLRYLRKGLTWAESPFSYHSIGSTISVHAETYAAVRGFSHLSAAEDFHFLRKARKVHDVLIRKDKVVTLVDRFSERVPFGTAAGCRAAYLDIKTKGFYQVYNHKSFSCIKALRRDVDQFYLDKKLTHLIKLIGSDQSFELDRKLKISAKLDAICRNSSGLEDYKNKAWHYFDALKEVQTLNFLNPVFPRQSIEAARDDLQHLILHEESDVF